MRVNNVGKKSALSAEGGSVGLSGMAAFRRATLLVRRTGRPLRRMVQPAGAAEAALDVVLDDDFAVPRQAFDAQRGLVRLLFLVDSSCPVCLREMADLNDALLEQLTAEPASARQP